jgi:hypothetical protein
MLRIVGSTWQADDRIGGFWLARSQDPHKESDFIESWIIDKKWIPILNEMEASEGPWKSLCLLELCTGQMVKWGNASLLEWDPVCDSFSSREKKKKYLEHHVVGFLSVYFYVKFKTLKS